MIRIGYLNAKFQPIVYSVRLDSLLLQAAAETLVRPSSAAYWAVKHNFLKSFK